MDFFGVKRVSMDSCKAAFTVLVIEEKRSVFLPISDLLTDSESFEATSAATFLDIKAVLKLAKIGSRSSSVSTAPPVMFLTLLVNVLNKPPTRPGFSAALLASALLASADADA